MEPASFAVQHLIDAFSSIQEENGTYSLEIPALKKMALLIRMIQYAGAHRGEKVNTEEMFQKSLEAVLTDYGNLNGVES
jgi:hypothetical protein